MPSLNHPNRRTKELENAYDILMQIGVEQDKKYRTCSNENNRVLAGGRKTQVLLEPEGGRHALNNDDTNISSPKKRLDEALQTVAEIGPKVYPACATTITRFVSKMKAASFNEVREAWSPKLGRKKAGDENAENPVQFILRVYKKEMTDGSLTREMLFSLDKNLSKAYAQWIGPDRHPEDAIWRDDFNSSKINAPNAKSGNPYLRVASPG